MMALVVIFFLFFPFRSVKCMEFTCKISTMQIFVMKWWYESNDRNNWNWPWDSYEKRTYNICPTIHLPTCDFFLLSHKHKLCLWAYDHIIYTIFLINSHRAIVCMCVFFLLFASINKYQEKSFIQCNSLLNGQRNK